MYAGASDRAARSYLCGMEWIVSSDSNVLATTSKNEPFVTRDLDLTLAEAAQDTYPRQVPVRPPRA